MLATYRTQRGYYFHCITLWDLRQYCLTKHIVFPSCFYWALMLILEPDSCVYTCLTALVQSRGNRDVWGSRTRELCGGNRVKICLGKLWNWSPVMILSHPPFGRLLRDECWSLVPHPVCLREGLTATQHHWWKVWAPARNHPSSCLGLDWHPQDLNGPPGLLDFPCSALKFCSV